MSSSVEAPGEPGKSAPVVILIALAISIALNLSLAVIAITRSSSPSAATLPTFDKSHWYAVALTTNETFVGHVTDVTTNDYALDNIYYLQFQATDTNGNPIPNPKPEDFRPILCKFGTNACRQLYGNKDSIRISRQTVVYLTELRPDSVIVQAILRFQQQQPGAPKPTASPHP
jgi:hypothetical protein